MKTTALAALVTLGALTAPAHAGPLADRLMSPIGKVFQGIAAKKQDRVFHAKGAGYEASFRTPAGEVYPAFVRLSRGRPSAPGKPEILGVAVKIKQPNGDQDVEMITAKSYRGFGSRIITTRAKFGGSSVSSILPFRNQYDRGPVTAYLPLALTTPVDGTGAAHGKESFDLTLRSTGIVAGVRKVLVRGLSGGMVGYDTSMGTVTVDMDKPLDAEQNRALKFNPNNAAAGVRPVGVINAIRGVAYKASQLGRKAPSDTVLPQ